MLFATAASICVNQESRGTLRIEVARTPCEPQLVALFIYLRSTCVDAKFAHATPAKENGIKVYINTGTNFA
jgi:hypothetical protein